MGRHTNPEQASDVIKNHYPQQKNGKMGRKDWEIQAKAIKKYVHHGIRILLGPEGRAT